MTAPFDAFVADAADSASAFLAEAPGALPALVDAWKSFEEKVAESTLLDLEVPFTKHDRDVMLATLAMLRLATGEAIMEGAIAQLHKHAFELMVYHLAAQVILGGAR